MFFFINYISKFKRDLTGYVCLYFKVQNLNSILILQVDCLQVDGVLQKRNLVYCASTRYFYYS